MIYYRIERDFLRKIHRIYRCDEMIYYRIESDGFLAVLDHVISRWSTIELKELSELPPYRL